MTCGTGPLCHHSPDCADRHCPGRRQDASTGSAWLLLPLPLLLVLFVALASVVGPTIDDHSAELAQADNMADALKAEDARLAQAEIIARRCGANTAWADMGGGWAQCFDKHGRKTVRVAMVQP